MPTTLINQPAGKGQTPLPDQTPAENGECDCSEGKYKNKIGELVSTGLHRHCCEYIKLKNSLIPVAEAFADSMAPLVKILQQTDDKIDGARF
jgi:hypothetical protein